jgi:hypothetical protein
LPNTRGMPHLRRTPLDVSPLRDVAVAWPELLVGVPEVLMVFPTAAAAAAAGDDGGALGPA